MGYFTGGDLQGLVLKSYAGAVGEAVLDVWCSG